MMTTPPSHLVLLSDLAHIQPGTKVRFAGRVTSYDPQHGILTLINPNEPESTYPSGLAEACATQPHNREEEAEAPRKPTKDEHHSQARAQPPRAHVEISHVLSTAPARLLDPGATVSVIGYIVNLPPVSSSSSAQVQAQVQVQALLMWDASAASPAGLAASAAADCAAPVAVEGGSDSGGYAQAVNMRARAMKQMEEARRRWG